MASREVLREALVGGVCHRGGRWCDGSRLVRRVLGDTGELWSLRPVNVGDQGSYTESCACAERYECQAV